VHLHVLIFFFQAEDGIRDATVTGVQTCALPIFARHCAWRDPTPRAMGWDGELRAQRIMETQQRVNEQIGSRKPDWAAPVGIATLQLRLGFTRLVPNRAVAKLKTMCRVVLG